MKILAVPHRSQLDNVYHPTGTCNLTCAAMLLEYHGIKPKDPDRQLEDELFEYVYDHKLSRHSPEDIAKTIRAHGCRDRFVWDATIGEVKEWIDKGFGVILHGMFTRSGHIIVGRGYNERGLVVNDPYGEYHRTGYDTTVSGAGLTYSYGLIADACAYDGEFWVHFVTK